MLIHYYIDKNLQHLFQILSLISKINIYGKNSNSIKGQTKER